MGLVHTSMSMISISIICLWDSMNDGLRIPPGSMNQWGLKQISIDMDYMSHVWSCLIFVELRLNHSLTAGGERTFYYLPKTKCHSILCVEAQCLCHWVARFRGSSKRNLPLLLLQKPGPLCWPGPPLLARSTSLLATTFLATTGC